MKKKKLYIDEFENYNNNIININNRILNELDVYLLKNKDKVFDILIHVETTGLNKNIDEVIAFSYILLQRGNVKSTGTFYFYYTINTDEARGLFYNNLKNNEYIAELRKDQERKFNFEYNYNTYKNFDFIRLMNKFNRNVSLIFFNEFSKNFTINNKINNLIKLLQYDYKTIDEMYFEARDTLNLTINDYRLRNNIIKNKMVKLYLIYLNTYFRDFYLKKDNEIREIFLDNYKKIMKDNFDIDNNIFKNLEKYEKKLLELLERSEKIANDTNNKKNEEIDLDLDLDISNDNNDNNEEENIDIDLDLDLDD